MNNEDVVREMRKVAATLDDSPQGYIEGWASTIEAAMRGPVAEFISTFVSGEWKGAIRVRWIGNPIPPGTKLYALPPDAAGEIERLRKALTAITQPIFGPNPGMKRVEIANAALAEDKP